MDNFKSKKKRHSTNRAVDGFVGDGIITKRFNSTYQPRRPTDSSQQFKRPDGFYPSRGDAPQFSRTAPSKAKQPIFKQPANSQSAAQSSPAFQNQSKVSKRSLFSFRKSKKSKNDTPRQSKRGRSKKFKTVGIGSLIVLLILGGALGYSYLKFRQIFRGDGEGAAALQKNVDPIKLRGEGDGRVNILILGKGGPGETAPDLTDTILLASIDPVQNEASLLSVPRDLYVRNKQGAAMKINAIYATEKQRALSGTQNSTADIERAEQLGTVAAMESVSEVLGIPMHYYIMVDFEAFRKAIDILGGINIDVKESLVDYSMAWMFGGNPVIAPEGVQTFDGFRALMYSRSRIGSSDFERGERQREVIIALKEKVMSVGTFTNPYKIQQLLATLGSNVRTDIGLNEINRIYEIGSQISNDKIASVGLTDPPNVLVRTDNIAGQSVVVPTEGLYQYADIRSFVRNNIKDAFLKQEDAKVLILNGTETVGLAAKTADELRSFGYTITDVANAPTKGYEQTVLVDLTNGQKKYTLSYLEKRMQTTATRALPDGAINSEGADFVIVIGQNEANRQ